MSNRQVGHLDPTFVALMNEVQELLRYAWQTDNQVTIPVSGTGSAAMEAAVANTVEPGQSVLVGCNGYFGERMVDMAFARYGGRRSPEWMHRGERRLIWIRSERQWKRPDRQYWD